MMIAEISQAHHGSLALYALTGLLLKVKPYKTQGRHESHNKSAAKNMTQQNKTDNTAARRAFIEKHKDLFWFTPADKKYKVSDELLITQVINEAGLDTTKEMFRVVGLERVRNILNGLQGRQSGNIYPEYLNLFLAYVNRHAQGNS